jgi:hypothetical protein
VNFLKLNYCCHFLSDKILKINKNLFSQKKLNFDM